MTLKERIDQYKQESAGKASPEMVQIMQRSKDELQGTVADRNIPRVGDTLPSFSLLDSNENNVDSDQLFESGALVVTFFRGMW